MEKRLDFFKDDGICAINNAEICKIKKSILKEVIDHKPEVKIDPQFIRKCYHIMF